MKPLLSLNKFVQSAKPGCEMTAEILRPPRCFHWVRDRRVLLVASLAKKSLFVCLSVCLFVCFQKVHLHLLPVSTGVQRGVRGREDMHIHPIFQLPGKDPPKRQKNLLERILGGRVSGIPGQGRSRRRHHFGDMHDGGCGGVSVAAVYRSLDGCQALQHEARNEARPREEVLVRSKKTIVVTSSRSGP
jgi:hypothetical protein